MTIGNMCVNPHTRTIKASYYWNIDAMQDAEGTWRYAVKEGGFPRGTVRFSMYSTAIDIGDVLVCVYRSPHPSLLLGLNSGGEYNMRGCEYLAGAALTETMGWVAGDAGGVWKLHARHLGGNPRHVQRRHPPISMDRRRLVPIRVEENAYGMLMGGR